MRLTPNKIYESIQQIPGVKEITIESWSGRPMRHIVKVSVCSENVGHVVLDEFHKLKERALPGHIIEISLQL